MRNKLERLQSIMADQEIDLVALAPGAHMHWVLGYHPHPDERATLLLVSHDSAAVLVPSVNEQDMRAHTNLPCFSWKDENGPVDALNEALSTCGISKGAKLSLDETARADVVLPLMRALDISDYHFASESVGVLRMRKDASELDQILRSAAVADKAMEAGLAIIKPGMTERQVAAVIRQAFVDNGVSISFALVASGPNGAFPHHSTGNRPISEGDAIVIDIGGSLDHFSSDMTRMAIVGEGPDNYAHVHSVVEEAVQAAMAAARPGVAARMVDQAARDVITAAGFGEYFVHRTGHGLGLEVHEPPYVTSTSETVLEPGMVFSIEPGVYLPGRFGIRLEDIVILEEHGPRVLSSLSRAAHKIS
ncbi:M24 family metallopeptidase [Microvirga pudoricolor]|uniref:M24 family metallopeptidase n=1 Tax=Microvirga pudoricolor TaxID=2778729 RepID=UPI0019503720|nr:M24 family metallopeptidase [Microvirga pudoricolor]MBM6596664.1 M24 family metallopeptidase [Microvirga pudoricolor]